jgi:hypothetical protein
VSSPLTRDSRSLASVAPGESARIHVILFDALRRMCEDIGVREGQSLRCRAGTGAMLLLDMPDGRVVSMARDWARHIIVDPGARTES